MRVLAVTSVGGACGIWNYAQMLQEAILPRGVRILPDASALDPANLAMGPTPPDVLWLNYHAGLHSRWTPEVVERIRTWHPRLPLVVTYHDTYDGTQAPNSANARELARLADVFVVHEPVSDIPEARVIRQGIPKPTAALQLSGPRFPGQPILGTAGFDFPWKNYTKLAELTAEIGWAFMCVSHDLTRDRRDALRQINPALFTMQEMFKNAPSFFTTEQMVGLLASCTATAWMYECANTGTSGAIRLGLAAMRPMYALRSCRQFRDLLDHSAMQRSWVDTWSDLRWALMHDGSHGHGAVALYATDSWDQQAIKYERAFQDAIEKRAGVQA